MELRVRGMHQETTHDVADSCRVWDSELPAQQWR